MATGVQHGKELSQPSRLAGKQPNKTKTTTLKTSSKNTWRASFRSLLPVKSLLGIAASLAMSFAVLAQAPANSDEPAAPGLSKLHFLCSGIRPLNSRFRLEGGVVCFNPSSREATSRWTFYTSNAEPTVVTLQLKPNGKTWGKSYPKDAWGLKIESSEPISVQGFFEYFSDPYNDDFTLTKDSERAFNQYSALSATRLGNVFYLPDTTDSPKPEKLMTVERQWFTVCNPNRAAAKVKFTDNLGTQGMDSQEITIPAERIAHFQMADIGLKRFVGGSVTIESDQPVAVLQTRTVEGTARSKFNQLRFSVFTFMLAGGLTAGGH